MQNLCDSLNPKILNLKKKYDYSGRNLQNKFVNNFMLTGIYTQAFAQIAKLSQQTRRPNPHNYNLIVIEL